MTKTGYRRGRIGDYSGGTTEDRRAAATAWRSLDYEFHELGNEDNLEQVARFLGIAPTTWPKVLEEFRRRYGDAKGIWLTRTRKDSDELYADYGDAEPVPYREEDIIVDLGPDGIYILDRRGRKMTSPKKKTRPVTAAPKGVRRVG